MNKADQVRKSEHEQFFIVFLAFVSLDINEEVTDTKTTVDSLMISESFSKSFEMLKLQLSRMIGDLNLLNGETGKLGTFQDTHSLREEM